MRVGLVVYGNLEQTSGGYRYDRQLVDALEARGDDVDVLSLPRSVEADDGTSAETWIRERLDRPYDVLLQDELCHPTLVEHNPHLEKPKTIVSLVHLLATSDPTETGLGTRARERRYLESVDATICPSAETRTRIAALTDVDLPTLVAPPGGRCEGAALSASAVESRAESDPFRVVFVGNVVPRKNVTALLEALVQVDDTTRDWTLTVAGSLEADPAYARTVRERAATLGLEDRVAFEGEVETPVLESVLERAHVLAAPSRYESFGMVSLEAIEYGVVPVASTAGGASEFVADGRNGFLVDPSDVDGLADRLVTLASDRNRLAALATAALETADAHPSWAETMGEVRTFLEGRLAAATASDGGETP